MPQKFEWRAMVSNDEGRLCVDNTPSRGTQRPSLPVLPLPPCDESVCEIPVLSPEYFLYLCKLKREAVELSIALNKDCSKTNGQVILGSEKKNDNGYKTTGYMVFTSYYMDEFDMLPRHLALKFLGPAWLAYPDKPVWQSYAHQYNMYARRIDFVSWLNEVQKYPRDGTVFILAPESYDKGLIEVSRRVQMPRKFRFLADTTMHSR